MDTLRAYILIMHAKVERERLRTRIRQLENEKEKSKPMTPNLKGIAAAFAQVRHDVETQAADVLQQLQSEAQNSTKELARAKNNIAIMKAANAEMRQFNDSIEGSNGGPPLAGSSDGAAPADQSQTQTQAQVSPQQPQGSWKQS